MMNSMNMEPITASLLSSFRLVPPAAIPAMLDCILASTNSSPSLLFNSLLNEFANVTKEITEESEAMDSQKHYCIGSYVGALCHLLKKSGTNIDAFQLFIWRTFLPILKLVHASDVEMFNEVLRMFFDVVAETNSWRVVETSLLPFLFRLVGLSMGMTHSEESAISKWSSHLNLQVSDDQSTNWQSFQCDNGNITSYFNTEPTLSQPDFLPLPVSCHILTLMLNTALEYEHMLCSTCNLNFTNGGSVENFARNLLWDLCDLSFQMLSRSVEHRSSAIRMLLPSIFEALESTCAFEVSIHGQKHQLSRNLLLVKIWACCKRLFSLGLSERRDAYAILSLYISSSSCNKRKDGNIDGNGNGETFDLRGDKELWVEIKRGLVDKENLVRKQSLHILKRILNMSEQRISDSDLPSGVSDVKSSEPRGLTKRERWAEKEASSLGVGKIYNVSDNLNSQQKWGAFTLLYEMLEEYGTHLVEAAWDHQMNLLLCSSSALVNQVSSSCAEGNQNKMETSEEICQWLAILWERGFCHDNPQVRCLIMQSFLRIASKDHENLLRSVPEEFILGPLLQGLNDPVHHKDFGLKGIYSSRTICSAAKFLCQYCSYLDGGKQIKFLSGLALLSKKHSFGRPGLMCFAECIAAAAHGVQQHDQVFYSTDNFLERDKTNLLDLFRFIIESSKQHFNASYRLQVCVKILDAATSVMSPVDVSLEILLHFISSLPREFTDFGGSLRMKMQKWLLMWSQEHFTSDHCSKNLELSKNLASFPRNFVYCHPACVSYNDEDVEKWDCEARRWARVTFLVLEEEQDLNTIFSFIQDSSLNLRKENNLMDWVPVKYFIIISSLIQELQVIQEKIAEGTWKKRMKTDHCFPTVLTPIDFLNESILLNNIFKLFLSIMEESVSFSKSSSSIFWSGLMEDESILPGSVRGRLGGPSQRRLSSSATTSVLQAIISLKSIASISRWCVQFRSESRVLFDSSIIFLWNFCLKVIKSPLGRSESDAEICLASYEAMAHVLKELVPTVSSSSLDLIIDRENLSNMTAENENFLDSFVQNFLQKVNQLLAVDNLVRTRRAILMNWKWICLESLLSIPKFVLKNENGIYVGSCKFFFSDNTVMLIFNDLVDNLENAGEISVLPILRSVRLIIELFASGRMGTLVSSCNGLNPQMMWDLVNPCWILHVSCNKRRVAPIAALLSSVLHHSVFSDKHMHEFDDTPGPLKWFINEILEEGTRSPRTIRLAALHLTGLWLRNPTTIKYYMRELKLLTLYGSVAFDEDFEAELAENQDAKSEVSTLSQSPDPELTEEFINTQLYARVSVAVLFNKLADMADLVGSIEGDKDENSLAALTSGKTFLLELLHSAVDDKDLSKELYKKYSAIHRRKVRVWQMICILSRFIDQDILEKVTCSLHKALQRNNLPSVRQYLETFAIQIYLKFPFLVGQELVPLLRDYDIKPQALSSYVFVAANVILHAAKPIQSRHLNELLPSIIPLLTSHHHTLRGFAQLLVHQILQKLLHARNSDSSVIMSIEKRCLMDLESYLMCNPDCARLRASMEGYLDAFDPDISITPAGIFSNRVEESEFECVSNTLMDQVINFLNDARDDLRSSMAKDAATIKNECLQMNDCTNHIGISRNADQEKFPIHGPEDVTLDFQKKFTLSKHEVQTTTSIFTDKKESFRSFTDIDKEGQLLDHLLHSRSLAVQKLRESRQQFILVASLIDRIPNLAGLARTCEVFRAAGLTIADKNILSDKQFQLISVTADKWVPITEVPVSTMKVFLQKKKREGFSILGLEQTANSIPLDQYAFPRKTVLVLGREKEGIPAEIIHILDSCVEIPQLGVVRSLNVHVSGAIALWEYTRQQRSQ